MQNRIEKLRSQIHHHNYLYYVLGKPEITDRQYDALFEKLVELEHEYPEFAHPNSPTQRVGSDLAGAVLKSVPHPTPMLSIKSFYNTSSLLSSPFGAVKGNLLIQPKYDGVAIELHYTNGQLTRALTRGNGYIGADVTTNIRTIKTIPLVLPKPETIIIRGEAVIGQAEMKRLNKTRRKLKQPLFNSPRNTVNALVKAQSTTETAAANISFIAWDARFQTVHSNQTESRTIDQIKSLGFLTPPCQTADSVNQAVTLAEKMANPENHNFPTDGAVIKIDNREQQQQAGHTKRNVNWAWALKPNNPSFQTTFRFVSYKVSKQGKITPIAHYRPFTHNGATFTKAKVTSGQVCNLGIGDQITITLAGGIIPKLSANITSGNNCSPARGNEALPVVEGTNGVCPACHQPLTNNRCQTGWCPSRGNTAETIISHTGWKTVIDLPFTPTGYDAAQAACLKHNAIVVRKKPNKHQYVIVADSLQTLANVAVTLGEIDPVKNYFEEKSAKQIHEEARQYIQKPLFHNKFAGNI
jgi:DNA ligase (NAD+)